MGSIEAACLIKYEELKDSCTKPGFKFAKYYDDAIKELQSLYDPNLLSEFWPPKKIAENCTESIRRRKRELITAIAISAETLEIDDDMKYIIVNKERKIFLQFDNQDKTGNRILIFFSETGAEIMQESKEWYIDDTFKNCPKIFKQLLTVQCLIKNEGINAAYMLLQSKTRDAYTAAFRGMSNVCISLSFLKKALAPSVILLDFEVAMQQACIIAFLNVIIKGKTCITNKIRF